MVWLHLASYFFGGAFLTNAVPHFVAGVMAEPGQPRAISHGMASGSGDRTYRKWMSRPSMVVLNCPKSFNIDSQRRQS